MIQKYLIFQKCNIGIKNAEFDAEFESVEQIAKRLTRKKLLAKK